MQQHTRSCFTQCDVDLWTNGKPDNAIITIFIRMLDGRSVQLSPSDLYRLIDFVAIVDPATWAKRYPVQVTTRGD